MNGIEWLVSHGARQDVVIACLMLFAVALVLAIISGIDAAAGRRAAAKANTASADWLTEAEYPVPGSLRSHSQVPPKAPPPPRHPFAKPGCYRSPTPFEESPQPTLPGFPIGSDIGSASLHAEHALAEARSDLHRAVARGICASEVEACRHAFRTALCRYEITTAQEYGL